MALRASARSPVFWLVVDAQRGAGSSIVCFPIRSPVFDDVIEARLGGSVGANKAGVRVVVGACVRVMRPRNADHRITRHQNW